MNEDNLIFLQLIDAYISKISSTNLVHSSDVVDFLLDLRLTLENKKELV